jgi:hypothetical protein
MFLGLTSPVFVAKVAYKQVSNPYEAGGVKLGMAAYDQLFAGSAETQYDCPISTPISGRRKAWQPTL